MATKENVAKIMPNNLEAEQSVLCAAMIDNEASVNIVASLKPEDFYSQAHKQIFEAMVNLYAHNKPIDFVMLTDALQSSGKLAGIGGIAYLTSLTNVLPSAAYYKSYVDVVKKNSVLRQIIEAGNKMAVESYKSNSEVDALGKAEKLLFDIAEKGQTSSLESLTESLTDVMENFEEIHKSGGKTQGVKTGFYQLDKITNGFQKSDLILLAARPSVGKTSLAMNIVTNAALGSGARCAVFSLEMSKQQLAQRMLCSVAHVNMTKARDGELTEADWTKLWKAHEQLSKCKIYVDDSSLNTPSQILSKCRKLKREKGLDLIMIDYLQLMKSDSKQDNRQAEISEISRNMKILAKEMNVPLLVLSQMSRSIEQRANKMPVLSDLRESGAIEQDADIVMFIHRPDLDEKRDASENAGKKSEDNKPKDYTVQLIIAKHRNGELGNVPLAWVGSRVSFVNLERDANEQSIVDAYEKMHEPRQTITEVDDLDLQGLDDDIFDD